jgi:endonuclease YncB( thermonuclease family)
VNPKLVLFLILLMWSGAYLVEWYRDTLIGQTLPVVVERVVDGDTIAVIVPSVNYLFFPARIRIRLRGIDAPELDQSFGNEATMITRGILQPRGGLGDDEEVLCRIWGKDEWGRYVADVMIRNGFYNHLVNVQKELVREGAAWSFPSFTRQQDAAADSLTELMEAAKTKKVGLWNSDSPVAPWIHRRRKRGMKERPDETPLFGGGERSPKWQAEAEQARQEAKQKRNR